MDESRAGIQSIEVAAPLLHALAQAGAALPLSQLAKLAGMPAAKAHRYLVSLIRVGLVRQDAASALYDLGPMALELGLAALNRIDALQLADLTLAALGEATGETVALATWGNLGPTYIRLLPSRRAVTVNLSIGSVLPLTYTASGLCFASWLPANESAPLLLPELARNAQEGLDAPHTMAQLQAQLEETRAHGIARVIGRLDPAAARLAPQRMVEQLLAGFNAFSAPVFNHQGQIQYAISVVGLAAYLGQDWQGPIACATREAARELSQKLGWRGQAV
ncbi:IclR family transcriptional regulator [Massilia sp. W12]|uniref:IclR family transcriptional regulator n=1 Tax=Massilia sp. W12 TaxID=3126507 RepID=UPI0030D37851